MSRFSTHFVFTTSIFVTLNVTLNVTLSSYFVHKKDHYENFSSSTFKVKKQLEKAKKWSEITFYFNLTFLVSEPFVLTSSKTVQNTIKPVKTNVFGSHDAFLFFPQYITRVNEKSGLLSRLCKHSEPLCKLFTSKRYSNSLQL